MARGAAPGHGQCPGSIFRLRCRGGPLRVTVTPAMSATPLTRTTGESAVICGATLSRDLLEGAHDADALDDDVGALVDDDVDAGHHGVGVDHRLARCEGRLAQVDVDPAHQRERRWRGGTSHAPLRLTPPMIADRALVGRGRRRRLAPLHGRRAAGSPGTGRSIVIGTRSRVRLRGVRRLEPLVELLEVEPSLAGGLAQQLGHLVAVGVGDAQLRRVARPVTGVLAGLQRSCHAAQPSRRWGLSRTGPTGRATGRAEGRLTCGG